MRRRLTRICLPCQIYLVIHRFAFRSQKRYVRTQKCALITHDKDIQADGTPVAELVHIMLNHKNPAAISKMMGHSQTATTMHYLRNVIQEDNLEETFRNLG